MNYITRYEWPFMGDVHSTTSWKLKSKLLSLIIYSCSRIWTSWPLNRSVVYNHIQLERIIEGRIEEKKKHGTNIRPLITVSNHNSCLDEPVMWGVLLKPSYIINGQLRWTPTAAELCFTNRPISAFFGYGQGVPVVRGHGVYQHGMDFCVNILNKGGWLHVFPEGKVNLEGDTRLKWGIGRLITDCKHFPLILPMWIIGMDDILPNKRPYIPRVGQKLSIYIGEVLDVETKIKEGLHDKPNPMEARKYVTDIIEAEFWKVKQDAICVTGHCS